MISQLQDGLDVTLEGRAVVLEVQLLEYPSLFLVANKCRRAGARPNFSLERLVLSQPEAFFTVKLPCSSSRFSKREVCMQEGRSAVLEVQHSPR